MLDRNSATESSEPVQGNLDPSPHLALTQGPVDQDLRPPAKPFNAKPLFKSHLFTKTLATKQGATKTNQGKMMSDRFSSDRMAAFSPQIPRRVADIPNPAAMRAAAENDGRSLIVGKAIRMKGEISGCERLVIDGTVDAALTDVKTIEVTASGQFKGTAEVETAVIAGVYEGTLKVAGHLEVASTGAIKGAVSYKTIMVANGGKLEGTIELT
ncbi:MAG: polymer-forming cytoskeletal protein [Rhodospirillaceae bacterium]|nr:polymer-forming cytoskeletal protein [Rhodospirillaceae bacterium]